MSRPLNWRKSSYSGSHGGDCVEVATAGDGAAVRDTEHREAGHLTLPSEEWTAFLVAVKSAEL